MHELLEQLDEEGIQERVHTGNICLAPEGARECVEQLRLSSIQAVQGRLDRALVSRRPQAKRLPEGPLLEKSFATLGCADIEYLARLPRKRSFIREGIEWLLCHGSVNSPSQILTGETSLMKFQRQREESTAQIIITGGAAAAFSVDIEGTLFVSPGPLLNQEGKIRYTLINTEVVPFDTRIILL